MTKQKFTIEHALKANSEGIIWEQISSAEGLSKWLADRVVSDDGVFTFSWGEPWNHHESRKADVTAVKKFKFIRFVWEDEDDTDAFWELKIERNELTNDCVLIITDFSAPDEIDDLKELWANSLELLHRSSGL